MMATPPRDVGMLRKVVVTGASGFVGRRMLDRLVAQRIPVVALSRQGTGRSDVEDIRIDDYLADGVLRQALSGASAVIHLAARAHQIGEQRSANTDRLYQCANVDVARAVARAARDAGLARMVLVSSIGVNGDATNGRPFRPDDVPMPVEPYSRSKWEAEQAVRHELAGSGTDEVIIRPPLVYGPGCPGNFERFARMVAWAPVLPFGGIHAPRTLVNIDNLADALLLAAWHPGVSRRTFIVTDGADVTVAGMTRALARGAGRSGWLVWPVPASCLGALAAIAGKSRAWGKFSSALQADGSEFCKATSWQAAKPPEQGLTETGNWFRAARRRTSGA